MAGLPPSAPARRCTPTTFPGRPRPRARSAGRLASLAAEKLAAGEELPPARPLYLRRPDAQVPANYKVVTPK